MTLNKLLPLLICTLLVTATESHADGVEIREWLVPWKNSNPSDPYLDSSGRVWFVAENGNFIGNLKPSDGTFNRYDVRPDSDPHNLIIDGDGNIWFAASRGRYIGKMSPSTGQTREFTMPDRKAKDPHTLTFDHQGNIWFTVLQSNFIGKLTTGNGEIQLIRIAGKKMMPGGIIVDQLNMPWAAATGSNHLLRIFPETMSIEEIELPDKNSRPVRLVSAVNGDIWYTDNSLGRLGRYRPQSHEFADWPVPGGEDSEPFAMAIDQYDRIWMVAVGTEPNRLIGFDTESGSFINETNIPSGGGNIRNLYYHEASGEIWFGTDGNYVGRAKVH